MKKLISLSLVLMMTLSVNAQLLWKISGNGLKDASYILGTHHACSSAFCDSIPGLKKAFGQVKAVVGEIDMLKAGQMSQEELMQMQSLMLMPSDTSLMSLFSQEEIALIDKYLLANLGANLQQLSMLKPMSIVVTLQNKILMEILPTMATMTGMDTHMQQLAAENGKEVGALETMTFQLNLLYASSLEEQADAMLEMAQTDNLKEMLVELTEVYKSCDLDALWKIFMEQTTELEYEKLVKTRNLRWEEQMKEMMPRQSTLFVVGAGHLPGEFGMIHLLRSAGYKVKAIKK